MKPRPSRRTDVATTPFSTVTPGAVAAPSRTTWMPPSKPKLRMNSLRRGRFLKSEPGPSTGKPSAFCEGTAAKKGEKMRS
ncbi:MAG: hypothetical protein QM704_09030 [Anaeromyxobacteraceae bacterium]